MSRQNVEATTRMVELHGRGEFEAILDVVDPEFELDLTERLPDQDVIRGREGYRDFLHNGFEMWSEFRIEIEEVIDAGDDVVVAYVRTEAVGQGSGAPVSERIAYVARFRDGLVLRLKVYPDRADALAAVGLGA